MKRIKTVCKLLVAFVLASIIVVVVLVYLWLRNAGYWVDPMKEQVCSKLAASYSDRPKGEIVFYGASNFRMWETMEDDMQPYTVQNHGIGGATDEELMQYADVLLYPFEPSIVFIQTGSNDNVAGLSADQIMKNKDKMYTEFHSKLPDATFVVMSGLPLPGRAEYWDSIREVNSYLEQYCRERDYMEFVDATDEMLQADGNFRKELFIYDGIHLNEEGHDVWTAVIKEKLTELDKK
ncbi:GDSL-type esterase/lipase family protein [Agathobacter sp.]|uniref:GDSL-type esterase/lipase family protein n=1 Tax=Agathobacter sp. TaxID=2021311 RepID=UPI003FD8BCF7